MPAPKPSDVLRALKKHVDVRAHSMRRFPTGLAHYVYEVLTDRQPYVVRLADPAHHNGIPGAVYWEKWLRPLGVPLPEFFGFDLEAPFPYMVLERLRGDDLGRVYESLSGPQKRALAESIAGIQDRVGQLRYAAGYGYLDSYEPQWSASTWWQVLDWGLRRAEKNIRSAGIFDPEVVGRVRKAAAPFETYFAHIQPAPFLDDTTTKNVIVHEGALQGIVDVDVVCFGDRLDVLALTHMAILGDGWDPDYVHYWAAAWKLKAEAMRMVNLYTAMHCVYFMGELGTRFNKDEPEPADPERVDRYKDVLENMLAGIG